MRKININFKKIYKSLIISIIFLFILKSDVKSIDVSAKSAILICADSGCQVWSKNETEPLPMASTTKIMTSILALEECSAHGNKEIEITPEMIRVEGTSMGLQAGDIVNLESLAKGMLLCSGNDAANATSIAVSGDTKQFVNLMNEKAKLLGMKDTKFSTPSGLDKDNHHSTARDMALLGAYAMENESFAKIVSQKSMPVKFINPSKTVNFKNHNKLLRLYPNCIGIKTGFTKLAGRCLVSCAQKDGIKLVCVTLNAPNDWDDHISLYNYGFQNTKIKTFNDKNFKSLIKITNGEKEEVPIEALKDFSISLNSEKENLIERKVDIPQSHNAPIEKGQVVGKIIYSLEGKSIGENDIVASETVNEKKIEKKGIIGSIVEFFKNFFKKQ